MIVARAQAKAILLGEHAVVHGWPAIALPVAALGVRAEVEALGGPGPLLAELHLPDLGLLWQAGQAFPEGLETIHHAFEAVIRRWGSGPLRVRVISHIPLGAGLGSSAAVAVALSRALAALMGQEADGEAIMASALEAERFFHGRPSGIDPAVIAHERPLLFRQGQVCSFLVPHPLVLPCLVAAYTGQPKETKRVIDAVHRARAMDEAGVDALFKRMGHLAMVAQEPLEQGRLDHLAEAMNEAQGLLSRLGVSAPANDRLITMAMNRGALGAKLSGGGMGGIILALAASPERALDLAQALMEGGAPWASPLGANHHEVIR